MISFYTVMSDYYFVTDLVGFDDKIGETVIDLEGNDDDDEYLLSLLQLSSPLS